MRGDARTRSPRNRAPSISLAVELDWFAERRSRRHLRGAGARLLQAGGPRRAAQRADRSGRRRSSCSPPARSTSRSPTSPRCCSRATRASRSSQSGAIVQRPLTSIVSLASQQDHDPRRAGRKDGRGVGSALRARLPAGDPQRGERARRLGHGAGRRASGSCRRCCRARSTRRSALLELRADPAAAHAQASERDPRRRRRRADLRSSSWSSCARGRSSTTRR